MSYKTQTIEWDVPEDNVQVGIPVGYEVEFSPNSFFYPITYRLTTFEEETESPQGTFYYSLDDGVTWVDFPIGEGGQTFYTAYKMRVVVSSATVGYIFAEKNGVIRKIDAYADKVIETYSIDGLTSTDIGIDTQTNSLYLSGKDATLYKVDTHNPLQAGDNSVNLRTEPLGFAIDGTRDSFWQVDRDKVCLKGLDGDEIFCVSNPFDIDVDFSSSSSSSESSSSSSQSSSSSSSSESSSSSSSQSSSSSSSNSSSSSSSTSLSSESSESAGAQSSSSSSVQYSSSSSSIDSSSSSSSESSSSSSSSSISSESSSSSSSESSSSSSSVSSDSSSSSSIDSSSSSSGWDCNSSIVPAMTSNTAPSPYVASASSKRGVSGVYEPFQAFDQGTSFGGWSNDENTDSTQTGNPWLQIYIGPTPKVVRNYSVSTSTVGTAILSSWNMYGSTNGSTWTLIDSRSGTAGGCFKHLNNYTAYNYYRLECTNWTLSGNVDVFQWNLEETQ